MKEYYNIKYDLGIQALGQLFREQGHEIRLVGGAVRDILDYKIPKDYDFATTATPEQMMKMTIGPWKVIPTGIDHGTVTFMSLFGSFEVTTLRVDVETDGRHAKVEFTTDWKEDAARRDFTINAMSMDMEGTLFDYFDGDDDLTYGRVVFVGNAEERIVEDALRIVRYFRFKAKFEDNSEVPEAINKNIHLLKNISVERVWQEVKKASENWQTFPYFFKHCPTIFEQFGFKFDIEEFEKNDVKWLASFIKDFPEFAIGSVMTMENALSFAKIFKLSIAETEKILFFTMEKTPTLDYNLMQDLLAAGFDRKWVEAILQFQNNFGLWAEFDKIEVPVFPVKGQDLIDLGHKQGPEMGITLRNMRKKWVNSRYTLSKEELLTQI